MLLQFAPDRRRLPRRHPGGDQRHRHQRADVADRPPADQHDRDAQERAEHLHDEADRAGGALLEIGGQRLHVDIEERADQHQRHQRPEEDPPILDDRRANRVPSRARRGLAQPVGEQSVVKDQRQAHGDRDQRQLQPDDPLERTGHPLAAVPRLDLGQEFRQPALDPEVGEEPQRRRHRADRHHRAVAILRQEVRHHDRRDEPRHQPGALPDRVPEHRARHLPRQRALPRRNRSHRLVHAQTEE
jgi:hypothetical protein